MSQFKELLVFGASRFMDVVYAKKFIGSFEGNIEGNAATATKATQDALGQNIAGTYLKDAVVNGQVVTFTKGDGTQFSLETQDTHVRVVDNLTSDSAEEALSANQGRVLEEEVEELREAATWSTY